MCIYYCHKSITMVILQKSVHILQMRYELRHEMLTFGTTNIDMEDLSQFRNLYGDYVLDRVKEMFNIVHLGGNSRRKWI